MSQKIKGNADTFWIILCHDDNIPPDRQSYTTNNLCSLKLIKVWLSTEVHVRVNYFLSEKIWVRHNQTSDSQPKRLIQRAAITLACLLMAFSQTLSFSHSNLMDRSPTLSSGVPAKVIFLRYPLITHHLVFIGQVFITTLLIAHRLKDEDFFFNGMHFPNGIIRPREEKWGEENERFSRPDKRRGGSVDEWQWSWLHLPEKSFK